MPHKNHTGKPLLSVIICTFNTKEITCRCLDNLILSIRELNRNVEVIIVENGNDGTGDNITKNYPWVKLIRPGKNTGFALGNNLGLAAADKRSEYVLLLNTDALVRPGTLTQAVNYMESHTGCDVLGCRLEFADGRMQPSAGFLPRPLPVCIWMWGLNLLPLISDISKPIHPKNPGYFSVARQVEWVMGAFFFARREVFSKTGGFDTGFFMYLEEVDLCKRINDLGMQIWYIPAFSITHLDKASAGGDIRNAIIREARGLVYFLRKYYPGSLFWLLPVIKTGLWARKMAFGILGNTYRQKISEEALKAV